MSRIGRAPIAIPAGVSVNVDDVNGVITVSGPKETLKRSYHKNLVISVEAGQLVVSRPNDEPKTRALHGLTRTLVSNMVTGVTEGFKKELEVNGVGYRVAKQGNQLVMNLGFSHQVFVDEIPGISIEVPAPNRIVIKGAEKEQVGQFAADVRSKRPPEPYKGKGIRYAGEVIVLKEGKTGGKGAKKK